MPFPEKPRINPDAQPKNELPRRTLLALAMAAIARFSGPRKSPDNFNGPKNKPEPQPENLETEFLKLANEIYFHIEYLESIIVKDQKFKINIQTNILGLQANSNSSVPSLKNHAGIQKKAKQIWESFAALPIKNSSPKPWKKFEIPEQGLTSADLQRLRELHDYYKTLHNAVVTAMAEIEPLANTDAEKISQIDFIPQIVETKNHKTQNIQIKLGVETVVAMKDGKKPASYYFSNIQGIYLP